MILVGTPCRTEVKSTYTFDLVYLLSHTGDLRYAMCPGTYLATQREKLAEAALMAEATHILYIDSDMRFPKEGLASLLSHKLPIVAANYQERKRKLNTASKKSVRIVSAGRTGLEEVDNIGFGFVLIETNVFRDLPRPWFATPWDGETLVTEDVFFCKKVREYTDYRIIIDHDLSQHVRHTGEAELGVL